MRPGSPRIEKFRNYSGTLECAISPLKRIDRE